MKNQKIQVFVRCRPLNPGERRSAIEVQPSRNEVNLASKETNFEFNQVFSHDAAQLDVYKAVVKPLVDEVLLGFNCTVFAYGQTGTGKTYTMEGNRSEGDFNWENDPHSGMIPRAISQLFDYLDSNDSVYTIRVSFLELYNEDTYDLLSPVEDTTKLRIYENPQKKGSVFVGGLQEKFVHTKEEIYDILKRGSAKRQTAATLLNACSSRSHTIFSVTVHIKEKSNDEEEKIRMGKLNLVDLAGSENIGRSGALAGRAREACNINQSLLALGRVITCASKGQSASHIPYRESKLTRLLQDSLGGKTKSSIIATISPALADLDDTLSTLEYASRARMITNKPFKNEKLTNSGLIQKYALEIKELQEDLEATRTKTGVYLPKDKYEDMMNQVRSKEEFMKTKQEDLEIMKKLFAESKAQLDEKDQLLSKAKAQQDRLLSKSKSLYKVAESATSDNNLLHSKRERIEKILKENKMHIDNYQSKYKDDMKRLEDTVDHYADDITESFKSLITDRDQKLASAYEDILKNLSSQESKLLQQADYHENLIKENVILAQEKRQEASEVNLKIKMYQKLVDDLSNRKDADSRQIQDISKFKSSMKREIFLQNQDFDSLFKKYKEDKKTGLTPQKKSYDIPSRLSLNSSMCEILEGEEK